MLVVLLGSFANAQLIDPPSIVWRGNGVAGGHGYTIEGTNYTVPEPAFRKQLAAVRDGISNEFFNWEWAIDQIGFDPQSNLSHRSDFSTTLTRNGQTGTVSVSVSVGFLEESSFQYSFAPAGPNPGWIESNRGGIESVREAAREWVNAQSPGAQVVILRRGFRPLTATIDGTNVSGTGFTSRLVRDYTDVLPDETITYDEEDRWYYEYTTVRPGTIDHIPAPSTFAAFTTIEVQRALFNRATASATRVAFGPEYSEQQFVTIYATLRSEVRGVADASRPEGWTQSHSEDFLNDNYSPATGCIGLSDAWHQHILDELNDGNSTEVPNDGSTVGLYLIDYFVSGAEYSYRHANGQTYTFLVFTDFSATRSSGGGVSGDRFSGSCVDDVIDRLLASDGN